MQKFTEEIKEGSSYKYDFSYTQEDVNKFSEISGDKNPIHLNKEYASKSIFGRRIIHGYLGTSVFSKVFAMSFPGEGTIYLKQDLKFLKPMFTNETYTSTFVVKEHDIERSRALVITEILDEKQNLIVTGEALILNKKFL